MDESTGREEIFEMIETALASIPGFYGLSGGPSAATPFGVYRPATVPADLAPQYVHL